MTLDFVGGRGIRRAGRVGKVGATLHRLFLRILYPGLINRPGLNAGGV